MRRAALVAALVALGAPAPAAAGRVVDAARADRGLRQAVAAGRLPAFEAARYRRDLAAAEAVLGRLPAWRAAPLRGLLADVARASGRYDAARALTLFSTLRLNARLAGSGGLPAAGRLVHDADGVAYRGVPGRGARFHPLASFGALNAAAARRDYRGTVRLAYALLARAHVRGGALVWESEYRTSGGTAPWTSGLTQAVAAQALARSGFRDEARLAYRAVTRGLLLRLPQGPWIRLYGHGRDVVLNAQLQAALSLAEYGRRAGDPSAVRLAAGLRTAAARLLPRFDTGFWSRYALGGDEATLEYHTYVTSLLWKLAARTGNPAWRRWAARFRADWRRPPVVRPLAPEGPALPVPADGFRDDAWVRFWLSKPATVTLRIAGERVVARVGAGVQRVRWSPGARRPGDYAVRIVAVDRVGNRSSRRLRPVFVRRDTSAPRVAASVRGGRLAWRGRDEMTPWLALRLEARRGGTTRTLDVGRRALRGSFRLPLDLERTWHATLVAADSSGNRRRVPLGTVGGLGRLPR